jgi:hypothetical protein
MIKLFGKWFGIDIEINKQNLYMGIGLYNLFYLEYTWNYSYKFEIWHSVYSDSVFWKHTEIGMMK